MSYEAYKNSGVPKRHMSFRPTADNTNTLWMQAYNSIKTKVRGGAIFAIVGSRGAGKTQLGVSLIGYVASEIHETVQYLKAFDIFLGIRAAINDRYDTEYSAVRRIVEPFLLVIDAYEVRSDSAFENRTLDHVLDLRYDAMKPTIIISNDTSKSFSEAIGTSIIDRIRETGGIVEMTGNSFR